MKTIVLSTLLAVSITLSAFSTDVTIEGSKISMRTLNNFRSDYGNISGVEWSMKEDFAKASFIYNNEKMEAFYDVTGQFIGSSKAVALDQMPLNVKRVFAKKYADYIVKETILFDGVDERSYYISAENDSRSVILHVSKEGAVSVFQSTKKK